MLGGRLLASACVSATFANISLPGAEILSTNARLVTNFSATGLSAYRFTQPTRQLTNATFCNVTITYTHPGQDDEIGVETWLPVNNWNNRFQAVGGGGWVAGRFFLSYGNMYGALADGYATSTTDAGLLPLGSLEASTWALASPGNVNLYNLNNLASVSLNDQALISKSVIKRFYGKGADYSYWNGCSQGGRQGLMLAQRYPNAYDGIAAGAPAINWVEFLPSIQWPQQVMNEMNQYPFSCELDALTAAAISVCDSLDGVEDNIIGEAVECLNQFDPFSMVGTTIYCNQTDNNIDISKAAAVVVNATWNGMVTENGKSTWFGVLPGSDLTGTSPASYGQPGIAATNCTSGSCVGLPSVLGLQWLQLFVVKDPKFDFTTLTRKQFDRLAHLSKSVYDSVIGTSDPDLSSFREAGGKLVTFHGIADNIIPIQGSEQYYNAVNLTVGTVRDFYRYYEAPGLGHCFGGRAGQPTSLFDQLRAWVENGTAPESSPYTITDQTGATQNRILCPYPEKAVFDTTCRDSAKATCFSCA
ncbi:Tannase/feruloyl esterase [Dactylonectria macrodidyma]|uniref:Carboxylic ester hydrolase n=1 Tax=Dactylonectria macrodidyma TaxID=307937 RepID=A0A9P9D934_9HYPO|nr:Tannase/feruloyl esterase [Dactylonectria macrodidyma]